MPRRRAFRVRKPRPKRYRKQRGARKKPRLTDPEPVGPPPTLRPFQEDGVTWLRARNWLAILGDAQGTGKTPTIIEAIKRDRHKLCPALIVVPSSVLVNWRREIRRWAPRLTVQVLQTVRQPVHARHFTVVSWDTMARRSSELASMGFRSLWADEAHYARNPETQRHLGLREVAAAVPRRVLASGTPLVNTVDELATLKDLVGAPEAPMLRRLLEDVAPDVPPKRRLWLTAAMPAEIRAEYDLAQDEFKDWLDTYLRALSGHTFPSADGGGLSTAEVVESTMASQAWYFAQFTYLRRILGRGKVPAAAAWVRERTRSGQPVVVFGMYRDVLELLGKALRALGIRFVRYDGTMNREQRQIAVDAFQGGGVDVFLGSQAAKEGITLVRACHTLFMERWLTPMAEEQAEDRTHRIGQSRPTSAWSLQAADTVDARLFEIVEAKRQLMRKEIGAPDIQEVEIEEVQDTWRQIKALAGGVPRVSETPAGRLKLPRLPATKNLQTLIFDSRVWPLDAVQEHLRKGRHRQLGMKQRGVIVAISTRNATGFDLRSLRTVNLGPGMQARIGRPVQKRKHRERNRRRVRRIRLR